MIYAIIIILALAIAFIILIRRLPGAFTPGQESSAEPIKSSFSFKMPTIRLPKMPSLPKRQPVAPSTPVVAPPASPVVATPPVPAKPTFKMPSFAMPSLKKSAPVEPVAEQEQPTAPMPPLATASTDFWDQGEKMKPITEPSTIVDAQKDKGKGKSVTSDADAAFMGRDYRKAERLYVRLAADDPKNPKIYSRLGIIYLEQSNYEDARDAFQQAIKLEPTVATRHFNLALVYMHLGSKVKAMAAMEQALKYDPSNRKYRKMLDNIMAGRA